MRKSIWNSIKDGCFIFTVITVITYTVGMLLSTAEKSFIPTLSLIYMFLGLSIGLGFANKLLANKKMSLAPRLALHFTVSAVLYYVVIVLCGGFSESGASTIIAMGIFLIIYLVFALIYCLINKKTESKKNAKKEYKSVFR